MADQTHFAQSVVEVAIAEARLVHAEVESRMAEITEPAEVNTSHAVGLLSDKIERVSAQTQVQTLHVVT